MSAFSITANTLTEPCGCRTWIEWDDHLQAWVRKSFPCYRHAGP